MFASNSCPCAGAENIRLAGQPNVGILFIMGAYAVAADKTENGNSYNQGYCNTDFHILLRLLVKMVFSE
jgi:hypothetical protein